jgi:hypothetical protein
MDNKTFKMSDDLIAVIREIVQLSLITGTNIVDHLRSVEIEVDNDSSTKLVPTIKYIEAYNAMVEELVKKAAEVQKKLDEQQAEQLQLEFVTSDEDATEKSGMN